MNISVWVLIVIINNGHFYNNVVPTLEFSSQEKCQAAVQVFRAETQDRRGTADMRCVRIEK